MSDARLDVVKRMWIEYREQGVDPALRLLHPEVEFLADDGEMWSGHEGVKKFFSLFESRGEEFAAAPYTFAEAGYLYFSHCVEDGLITRIAAWNTRAEAELDVAADGVGR